MKTPFVLYGPFYGSRWNDRDADELTYGDRAVRYHVHVWELEGAPEEAALDRIAASNVPFLVRYLEEEPVFRVECRWDVSFTFHRRGGKTFRGNAAISEFAGKYSAAPDEELGLKIRIPSGGAWDPSHDPRREYLAVPSGFACMRADDPEALPVVTEGAHSPAFFLPRWPKRPPRKKGPPKGLRHGRRRSRE